MEYHICRHTTNVIKNTYIFGIVLYSINMITHHVNTKNKYFKFLLISYLIHKINMVNHMSEKYSIRIYENSSNVVSPQ